MPTDRSLAVRVEGLADFQKELKRLDQKLPRELQKANKRAAELVADAARTRATGLGSVAAKAAPSIKAAAEQRRSKVSIGGARYPFALGAEFGGQGRPTTMQFAPWSGSDTGAGYFLYPAIRETRDEFMDAYDDAIEQLTREAFPTGWRRLKRS